jgi:type II secretory pathway pseudopilin PulG
MYTDKNKTVLTFTDRAHRKSHHVGFSLVEIAVVLVIIGLVVTLFSAPLLGQLQVRRAEDTRLRLTGIDNALAVYVSTNRRLPCPANGTLDGAAGVVNAGLENASTTSPRTCVGTQQNGVIPWKTLGLSLADVTDAWGNVITYRVEPALVVDDAMNFTGCAPGGTAAAMGTVASRCATTCSAAMFPAGCTPPNNAIANRGLRVQDRAGTILNNPADTPPGPNIITGAAYILISHGENQMGARNPSGILSGGSIVMGTEEAKNDVTLPYVNAATYYLVDDQAAYGEGTGHFDDIVVRRTILSVAAKAQLSPRAY